MGSERLNVGLRIREAAALRSAGKPRDALDLTEATARLPSVNVRQRVLLHTNRAACWMDLDEVELARREAGRGYALDTNDLGILAVYSRINAAERRG